MRVAHRPFKAWPVRSVIDALISAAFAQIADLAGAQELMVNLQPRAGCVLEALSEVTSAETICEVTLATRFGRRAPQVSSVVIS